MNSETKSLLKLVLIGDANVGKTSLVERYVKRRFTERKRSTIGQNFSTKQVLFDDRVVTILIWETGGQERFDCFVHICQTPDFCILVFDVTSYDSFKALDEWRDEFLLRARPRDPLNFPFIVVGNKVDLGNRIVSNREVNDWCQRNNNIPYYETSAREGTNLDLTFQTIFWNALKQEANQSNEGSDFFDTISLQFPDNYREKSKEYKC